MKALTNPELISFCRQAALLLRSGISAAEGLYLMAEDTPQEEGKELLSSLSRELEQTGSLAGALQAAAVFPSYMCAMVRIGEETGRLDDVMEAWPDILSGRTASPGISAAPSPIPWP